MKIFQNIFDQMLTMEILYVYVTQILLPVYPDIIQVWKLIIESFYILFLNTALDTA